ncbi:MAG TPA: MotA/TolQ/ExbB proton channel family protein [Candidatus Cloacimonadota bacterium]|nr:MotA/TolQ/ExbB proton channel family protein [Candidatus Cloacimonadota bacterium]HPT71705.1 MotA/TolQ/ExbB proton channel family protein [Candidatus Cloacimonadota bacterium]
MSLIDLFTKGGPLMYVLLLFSIMTVAIIIEKIIELRKASKLDKYFTVELNAMKNMAEMKHYFGSTTIKSPLGRVIRKGFSLLDMGIEEARDAMIGTASIEIHTLERHLGMLSTLSAVSPLVGFLGTVTGMVKVFQKIQGNTAGVDISLLAGGIWEALLTTVGGLIVGIIALMFYNSLVTKTEAMTKIMEETSNDFLLRVKKELGKSE